MGAHVRYAPEVQHENGVNVIRQDTEFIHVQMGGSCCQCIPDLVRAALPAAMDFSAIFGMTVRLTNYSEIPANDQPMVNAKLLLSG